MFKTSLKNSAISKIVAVLVVITVVMPNALLISPSFAQANEGESSTASSDTPSSSNESTDSSDSSGSESESGSESSSDSNAPVSSDSSDETATVESESSTEVKTEANTPASDASETEATDNTNTQNQTTDGSTPKADETPTQTEITPVDEIPTITPDTDTNTNGGGSDNSDNTGEIAAVGAPTVGSIKVCYVVVDQFENVMTNRMDIPAARFAVNLEDPSANSIGTVNFDTTLFTPNTIVLTGDTANDAECVTYSNLPINSAAYRYSQEVITGPSIGTWQAPKYNDVVEGTVSLGSFYEFDSNTSSADGGIVLTADRPDRVLTVVNRFVPATSGQITVCTMFIDQDGNVATNGSGLTTGSFEIGLKHAVDGSNVSTTTFTTSGFAPNTKVISNTTNDAQCVTYDNLSFDEPHGYYYSEMLATNGPTNGVWVSKYDDLAFVHVNTVLESFYPYQFELFDNDPNNDADNNRNVDADGHIRIDPRYPERTLVILNQYVEVCSDGVLTPAGFTFSRENGNINFYFDAVETGSTTATFHITNNSGCTAPVSLTSYKIFDNEMENWQLFDNTGVVNVNESATLTVDLPPCMSMIYAWYGQGVSSFTSTQQQGYYSDTNRNPHIFDKARHFNTGPFCENDNGGNNAPVITVLGDNPFRITVGNTFTDPGATATDAEEGDITARISTTTNVDTNTVGTYTITYRVSDTPGLIDEETRTVIVEEQGNNGGGGGGSSGGRSRNSSGGRGGSVLGEEIGPTVCPYLNDYLRIDWNNNPTEVLKLQYFLKFYAEKSDLQTTGIFDQATFNAVSEFQTEYMADVLSPWGHDKATGFVYILTKKKINEIVCNTTITLTDAQSGEIAAFRALLGGETTGGSNGSDNSLIGGGVKDISDLVGSDTTGTPTVAIFGENEEGSTTNNIKALASAIWSLPKDRGMLLQSLYFLLIAIIAIYLATEIVVGSMKTESLNKYQIWSRKATGYIIGLVLAIIVAIWYKVFAIVIPLIVLIIVSGAFLASAMTKRNGDKVIPLPPTSK
jgi:hypothetical protein